MKKYLKSKIEDWYDEKAIAEMIDSESDESMKLDRKSIIIIVFYICYLVILCAIMVFIIVA